MNFSVSKSSRKILQDESDTVNTNFWPNKPRQTVQSRQSFQNKRSQDLSISRPRSVGYNRKFRIIKGLNQTKKQIKSTSNLLVYKKQLEYFSQLYDHLGNVLSSIRTGLQDFEKAVSDYGRYIQNPNMSFIDDFIQNRDHKIKKSIRTSRIHECLSIAYLFLEIAQGRMNYNESYLVNFIGHSLSNLVFTARIYILLENQKEYEKMEFHQRVQEFEMNSYGQILTNLNDVLIRIQHNNEIITLIHKKLGRGNEKFQQCIKNFLKNADRKKYTTCMCSHYVFEYLAMHIYESELEGISEFLQVAPTPYLPPNHTKYTVIIEPIGILKHGNMLRPYLMECMKWLSQRFDVVLWTWQMPYEMQEFVKLIDPYLTAKLYRYHCIYKNQIFMKDLNRIGRDLTKTLIIDYDPRIFPYHPKNGFTARWKGKKQDKGLLVICEILEELLTSQSSVEEMLIFYAQQLYSIRGI